MNSPILAPARPAATGLFGNGFVTVDTVPATTAAGAPYDHTRVVSGEGLGAVVVPLRISRGMVSVGLIDQFRPVLDRRILELPRGRTSDLGSAEAARELVEETGVRARSMRHLGVIHPDTGLLTTQVSVWTAIADPADAQASMGHVEDESGAQTAWYDFGQVLGLVMRGGVTCSMTLSALFLAQQQGVFAAAEAH